MARDLFAFRGAIIGHMSNMGRGLAARLKHGLKDQFWFEGKKIVFFSCMIGYHWPVPSGDPMRGRAMSSWPAGNGSWLGEMCWLGPAGGGGDRMEPYNGHKSRIHLD